MLKRLFLQGACLGMVLGIFLGAKGSPPTWEELKGDHFIVYYTGAGDFAKDVLRKAEECYSRVGEDLGYARHSKFWQWEKRVKIYIYKTHEDFVRGTGRQKWSHGYADYHAKKIFSYEWKEGFLDALLPHEITHLIFRDYVGFRGEVPVWLDEGVAQWQEPAKRGAVRQLMKFYFYDEKGYSLKNLTEIDVQNVRTKLAVDLFYTQSASVIDFLVTKYGGDRFVDFCRQLRDGKKMDEALPFAYPLQIRNLNELEEQWKQYILSAP